MQVLLPVMLLVAAALIFWRKKDGEVELDDDGEKKQIPPTPTPDDDDDDGEAPPTPPEPDKTLSRAGRKKLSTMLSMIGYPATPDSPNIPYSTRVMWVLDFRKVRNAVRAGKMTRVWPVGSPGKQKPVKKGLSDASLAAATWANSSQYAGIAWKELVTQARGL